MMWRGNFRNPPALGFGKGSPPYDHAVIPCSGALAGLLHT